MRNFDFAPLWRSTIGFDRLFDMLNETQRAEVDNYPPTMFCALARTATGLD
jgi:molecular chaperone IbpA